MQLSTNKSFAPTTLSEAISFSEMLASSSMIPKQFQGKPEDVLVCVQWGCEIGLAPLQALQNIAVVNGKPSIYGDAAMALVQASSVCEDVEEYFEGEGTPNPVAVCVARRKGRKAVTVRFGIDDAKRAGLWGKQGPWSMYPKRMMQMRARGFALRDAVHRVGSITSLAEQELPCAANTSSTAGDSDEQVANRSDAGANNHRDHPGRSAQVDNRQLKRAVDLCVGKHSVDCCCRRHRIAYGAGACGANQNAAGNLRSSQSDRGSRRLGRCLNAHDDFVGVAIGELVSTT